MLNYCCLFHKYDVSLTPYCETTFELATTFNCLGRWSPNASSIVVTRVISLTDKLKWSGKTGGPEM